MSTRVIVPALAGVAALCMAGGAAAQVFGSPDPGNRAGRWDVYGNVRAILGEEVTFDGGTRVDSESDVGFGLGFGYNFDDHWLLGGEFGWANVDYTGTLRSADDPPGPDEAISGEYETLGVNANLTYHFLTGPLTPYVSASLGYAWVDTNIADGPPQLGCWWDPWFGQICTVFQDTKSDDGVTYGIGAGVRWEFARGWFGRVGYDERFVDIGKANGTPGFGSVRFDVGTRF